MATPTAKGKQHLGGYDYDCPHDRPLFEFLGTNGDEFDRKVAERKAASGDLADWIDKAVFPKGIALEGERPH